MDGGDGCPEEAKTVYVVDSNRTLSAFDPPTKAFRNLGQLACPAGASATPFSMAVDRTAVAYVLYTSGELFRVETATLGCTKTQFGPDGGHGLRQFGMGFSTEAVGGTVDSLFIAGGSSVSSTSTLARLDVSSFAVTPLGAVTSWPELSGTGDAKLWGFFPSVGGSTPKVAQIDKSNATLQQTFPAPTLGGAPSAWAFAFWGGRFWIFLQRSGEASTTVYEMNATTGALTTALPNTGRRIVGAGVSTCAPVNVN